MYIEHGCSVGMFRAKFLCIFDTFLNMQTFYLDEFVCLLSDLPTVITSLVLSFQEAKASGCKAVGEFFFFDRIMQVGIFYYLF